MNNKTKIILGFGLVGAILLTNVGFVFAQDAEPMVMERVSLEADFEGPDTIAKPVLEPELTEEDPQNPENLEKQQVFLERIQSELNLSKTDYRQVLKNIHDTKVKLDEVSESKLTLASQLDNLDGQIGETTKRLFTVIRQVTAMENEVTLLSEDIEMREIAIAQQKELLKDYLVIIYKEENNYLSFDEDGNLDAFKMLLADGSVGTNLRELKYLDTLNEAGQQMIDKLSYMTGEIERQQDVIDVKKVELIELQRRIQVDKDQLELQRESKQSLLDLTLGQEAVYSELLEQTIAQQEQLLNDVKNLNNAVQFIEKKISEDGDDFDPDKYMSLLDYKTQALYKFQLSNTEINEGGFVWPVDPSRGISAYFRDPKYVGVFGVQHNATDIPAYQGSPLRAAADGVVYTARDNGYGYSYVIIAHSNGFMTVYGHMSSILVEEGQTLGQGAIIGLSGGMPGTKGAGYMTTGPHLHFEMLLNGLYVDGLNFLPLEKLTEDQIGVLPKKYQDAWDEAVLGESFKAISRF